MAFLHRNNEILLIYDGKRKHAIDKIKNRRDRLRFKHNYSTAKFYIVKKGHIFAFVIKGVCSFCWIIVYVWSKYDGANIEQRTIGYGWRQNQEAKLKIVGRGIS